MLNKSRIRGKAVEIRGPFILVRPETLAERVGNETLVVCGASRGRTSVASFTLHKMGYFLGDRLSEINLEDLDFLAAIPEPKGGEGRIKSSAPTLDLIAKRNAEHARWGFKLPRVTSQLAELEPLLRNPVFMICLRNPVSVARTILRREEGAPSVAFSKLIDHGMRPFMALQSMMDEVSAPLIIADMDEAAAQPLAFVKQLAGMLGLDGPIAEIAENIAVPGYKRTILTPAELGHIKREKQQAAQGSIIRPGSGAVKS